MAAKFFTGLPLDGPDPECVLGHGAHALAVRDGSPALPKPTPDHSRRPRREPVALLPRRPDRACDESPLASFEPPHQHG